MSALLVIFAVALADPAAARYCEGRVASLPAADRDEANERCLFVLSDFLRAHDRVEALKRLAQLEAWLRLRAEPVAARPVGDCAQVVSEKEPELQREAAERLAAGRRNLRRQLPSDDSHKDPRSHDGDLMNPF